MLKFSEICPNGEESEDDGTCEEEKKVKEEGFYVALEVGFIYGLCFTLWFFCHLCLLAYFRNIKDCRKNTYSKINQNDNNSTIIDTNRNLTTEINYITVNAAPAPVNAAPAPVNNVVQQLDNKEMAKIERDDAKNRREEREYKLKMKELEIKDKQEKEDKERKHELEIAKLKNSENQRVEDTSHTQ